MPYFDVIVPTYNNAEQVASCLRSLDKQTFRDFAVIVCVDGSTDATDTVLASLEISVPLMVRRHPDKKNHGRNAARNLALALVDSKYCVTLDSDLVAQPDMLERHYELARDHKRVLVGEVEYTNLAENFWAQYLQTRGKRRHSHGAEIPYRYFNTGNAAFPSDVFLELGGQDSAMKNYGGGDVEFAIRMHKHYGLTTMYNSLSIASGVMEKSLDFALAQMEEMGASNLRYIHQKHPEVCDILGMSYLTGQGITEKAVRSLLKLDARFHRWPLFGLLPKALRNRLIEYEVLARLYKGFYRNTK